MRALELNSEYFGVSRLRLMETAGHNVALEVASRFKPERIAKDLDETIEGEDVLLVEDIVDTGFTARYLLQTLAARGPNSLALCTLLDRT